MMFCVMAIFTGVARANMYDVFEPHKLFPKECASGCAPWGDVAAWRNATNGTWYRPPNHRATDIRDIYASFADGKIPAGASNLCAMPGMASPGDAGNASWPDHVQSGYAGSFCFCEDSTKAKNAVGRYFAAYCRSAMGVPEQINLQIASAETVVAGFVTFERAFPADPPVAELSLAGSSAKKQQLSGVSHWYVEKACKNTNYPNTNPCMQGRNYTMSFVKFTGLQPGRRYTYRLKSGAPDGQWSDTFTFRSVQPEGGTARLAVYGDMGVYGYNNMQNLRQDCEDGTIDAIVHMGDHVYFWEDGDNRRGDAYMNAFQPTLSGCPWMPILGNHEYNDADDSWRVVNQTWGEAYGQEDRVGDVVPDEELSTTTDTAIGHYMTRHNLYSQGSHGATPSGTSRWYSVNIGSMHLVGLDLGQSGQQVGPSNTTGESPAYWHEQQTDQISWLQKDLAAVDRKVTPWVMVMSHYPFYHTSLEENAEMSSDWYVSPEAETYVGQLARKFKPCENGRSCRTVHEHVSAVRDVLVPIFYEHGVDFYNAGHVHDYTVNWPLDNASKVTQRNYDNPLGTIHICEGNGGVPAGGYTCGVEGNSPNNKSCVAPCVADYCRTHKFDPAYGRWITSNASVLTYQHVPNDPSHFASGSETWHVTQSHHGPFGKR